MKKRIERFLPRGGIRRDMVMLVGATAIGAGLYLLMIPVLTHLYSPAAFGELAVFVAVLAIVVVVSSWRYEAAIPIASTPDEVHALSALSFVLVAAMALISGAIAALLAGAGFLPGLTAPFGLFLGGGILFGGIAQVIVANELRASRYEAVALMRFIRPTATGLVQLSLSQLTRSGAGLVGGEVTGRGIAALTLIVARPTVLRNSFTVQRSSIRKAATRFRRFPLYSAPASLINAAGVNLPVVLVGALFGLSTAGFLGVTQRILGMGSTLVGRSLSQVYIGRASEQIRASDISGLSHLFKQMARRLAAIFTLPFLVVVVFAPLLAQYLLGPEWRSVGEFARLLAPAFFVQIVVVPMSSTLNLLERQPLQLGWDIFRLVAVMSAIIVTYLVKASPTAVVAAFSAAQVLSYGLMYGLISLAIRDAEKEPTLAP